MRISNGLVFCDDGLFRQLDVEVRGDRIAALHSRPCDGGEEVLDCGGKYVVPGFVEIHIHGAMGADFCDGSPAAIDTMAAFLLRSGVTSFLGTSMALPKERLAKIYAAARGCVGRQYPGRAVLRGINMEGPFFSMKRRGAQNEKYIVPASYNTFCELNAASGGHIRTVAVAPEVEEAFDFIPRAAVDCSVSLAHSAAGYDIARQAFALGANHVTHLLNGMEPFTNRDPGIPGAAADADACVEVISDGVHLHPSTVRAVFKMFSRDRVCLISDGMRACGMPEGQYDLGGQRVTVRGSAATIEGGSLAGSVTPLFDCFKRAVSFGVPLETALMAASLNPARSVGLGKEIGSITCGKRADLLVLDRDLNMETVVLGGVVQPPAAS